MSKSLKYIFLILLLFTFASDAFAATVVTGTIYRDYNDSGTRDTGGNYNEPPVANVTITAFNLDGSIADTTSSDNLGQYTLNLPDALDGERVRLEFSNIPNGLEPGIHAGSGIDGAGTTVQFITGGGAPAPVIVDLPLSSRGDYCGDGNAPQPSLVTSCFVFDDQTSTASTVVQIDYDARTTGAPYTELANAMESGTVYGFGYHNPTNVIFFANYVRRHAGTTPNGGAAGNNLDTLYAYSINTDTLVTFDMGTLGAASFGSDGRSAGWDFIEEDNAANADVDNWDMVGKVGAGDVEQSSDGTQLFVTNLFARRVEIFNINYGNATAAGGYNPNANTTNLTYAGSIGPFNPGCSNGVARPFGLGFHDDQLYIAVLCTGENGGTQADLSAHVYAGNTLVFSMDLQFDPNPNHRGCAGAGFGGTCGASGIGNHYGDWNPWSSSFTFQGREALDPNGGIQVSRPEPLFSDIEFDNNGDMILGFRDRYGDMVGVNSLSEPGNNTLYSSWAAGDIIRVCNVGGSFVLEGNASGNCPQYAPGNGDGPNGGEFYLGDNAVGGFHGEATQGALVQVSGTNEVVTSFMDPTGTIFSGGFRWISNLTGNSGNADGYELFATLGGPVPTGGKGNGLGDVEALCPPPPLEIGNLVWIEDIRDGIQGTGVEITLDGIVLELVDPTTGNVIAQTTTDISGHYYFNAGSEWDTNNDGVFTDDPPLWDVDGDGIYDVGVEPRGIMPFTTYTVRVAASNFMPGAALENYFPTAVNVGSGITENNFRISDSEGLSVTFRTSAFGVNNHTLDFGFTLLPTQNTPPPPPQITPSGGNGNPTIFKSVDRPFALPGDNVTWSIIVQNLSDTSLPNVGFTDTLPQELEILSASATAGNVSINGQQVIFNIPQLAARQSITVDVLTRIRSDVTPPFFITNIALLAEPYQGESSTSVISIQRLPDTGDTAINRPLLLSLGAISLLALLIFSRRTYLKYKSS